MDKDTPRGMIRGLLKISEKSIDDEETEKRVPTVQQTPSASLARALASPRTLVSLNRFVIRFKVLSSIITMYRRMI